MTSSDDDPPKSEFVLYQTEDRRMRIERGFEEVTSWLTQAHVVPAAGLPSIQSSVIHAKQAASEVA